MNSTSSFIEIETQLSTAIRIIYYKYKTFYIFFLFSKKDIVN